MLAVIPAKFLGEEDNIAFDKHLLLKAKRQCLIP